MTSRRAWWDEPDPAPVEPAPATSGLTIRRVVRAKHEPFWWALCPGCGWELSGSVLELGEADARLLVDTHAELCAKGARS